jgi:hypothetical protein
VAESIKCIEPVSSSYFATLPPFLCAFPEHSASLLLEPFSSRLVYMLDIGKFCCCCQSNFMRTYCTYVHMLATYIVFGTYLCTCVRVKNNI